jgi:hypothetical protein
MMLPCCACLLCCFDQVNECSADINTLSQRWFVDDASRLRPTNAPLMCLDVAGGWATIATCSTSNTQKFYMNTTALLREYHLC